MVKGDVGGGLHALGVHNGRCRRRRPSTVVTDESGEVVVQFGEDTLGAPGGEVAVDGAIGRKVVRQVPPRDAGPVQIQQGVEDLAQFVDRRAARDTDGGASVRSGLPPGGQPGFDEGPAGVGQVGRIGATARSLVGHDVQVRVPGPDDQDHRSAQSTIKVNQTRMKDTMPRIGTQPTRCHRTNQGQSGSSSTILETRTGPSPHPHQSNVQ